MTAERGRGLLELTGLRALGVGRRGLFRPLVLCLSGLFFAAGLPALAAPAQPPPNPSTDEGGLPPAQRAGETALFPLEALESGQQGYAVTAGVDNVPTRFSVEVLALQYDLGTGFPLVLVRARGAIIARAGGIAAGMSGSPVYLPYGGEEALLGAIGFTFLGSGGGLALVTPIETMRQADPRPPEDAPAAFGPAFDLSKRVPVRTPFLLEGLGGRAAELLTPLFSDWALPVPLNTPTRLQVSSSGAPSALLSPSPLSPSPNPSPNPYETDDRAFEPLPGSAVSVQLVRGDVTVAAVGTLTLLEEGRFWAFGHPLLGQGEVSFALAPAYVAAIVPSRDVPFKLADSGRRVLGSVTQDRPYALSGSLGGAPEVIPVTLTLQRGGERLTKRFEVAADERLYPTLLASASLQALDELIAETSGGTAALAWEVRLRGGRTLRLLEETTDPADLALAAAALAASPLQVLADNPFRAAEVEQLELNITLEPELRLAEIAEVVLDRETLPSGGALSLNVRLQPYRADPEVERVRVQLPETLVGEIELSVRGGFAEAELEGEDADAPLLSFEELLSALEERVQARELVVETLVDGEVQVLARHPLPYLVSGNETRTVTVEAPEGGGEGEPGETPDAEAGEELQESPESDPPPPRDDPLEEGPSLVPAARLGGPQDA